MTDVLEASPEARVGSATDLIARIEKLMSPNTQTMWAEVSGVPARDGHPGLGFRGFEDFSSDALDGVIGVERGQHIPDSLQLTFWASGGRVGRPISQKSIPEITGGDVSQRFRALRIELVPDTQASQMRGLTQEGWQRVEGLYGEGSHTTTTPDAYLFAAGCLKVLESGRVETFYDPCPEIGARALSACTAEGALE